MLTNLGNGCDLDYQLCDLARPSWLDLASTAAHLGVPGALGGSISILKRNSLFYIIPFWHTAAFGSRWLPRSGSRWARVACSIGLGVQQRAGWLDLYYTWLESSARLVCSIGSGQVDRSNWPDLPANESPNA